MWEIEEIYNRLSIDPDTKQSRPIDECVDICDFLINAFGIQMASVPLEMFLINPQRYIHSQCDTHIPLVAKISTETIDISNINVVGYPTDFIAMANAVTDIKSSMGFDAAKQSHNAAYYKELNLILFPVDGNHHGAAANVYNKGSMRVDVYELSPYFDRLKANDEMWIYYENDERQTVPIIDSRLAAMYNYAKKKYELQKSLNSNI